MHKNVPAMLSAFTTILSEAGLNIANIINKSKKDVAYTMIETDSAPTDEIIKKIESTDGVIRARLLIK